MIAKLIEFSIRNKLLVLLVTAALVGAGVWATLSSSIDAIPDLSDMQVIVITDYPGQAPQVVEDQVTYPLTTALAGVGAKVVRGFSMFETSMVYVIFPDGTSLRDARERVLEYLNYARDRLPAGVEPKLGPDATGVGWVYQYVLYPGYYDSDHPQGVWHDAQNGTWYAQPSDAPAERQEQLEKVRGFDKAGASPLTGKPLLSSNQDPASLRSLQDWYLRFPLTSVNGVAEVASIGGFVKEYQVVLKPEKLLAYHLAIKDLMMAVQRSNNDVGGSVVEMSENEYMVRSRGYLHGLKDLAQVPVAIAGGSSAMTQAPGGMAKSPSGTANEGVPVLLKDVATLQIAGEERRGVGEWNGQGEAVSGIVISRYGANAYQVIKDAKAKLSELEAGLPPGVTIKTVYDRSDLIERSIHTLRHTLIEEMIVVSLVCILFLLHARSALVAIFVIPSSMLISLLTMHLLDINANIMSLGGIAIAIGVVVDSAIIMVENAHKHLNHDEERVKEGAGPRPHGELILEAAKEVGPSLFFSLLIITVSFLPVFVLGGESGRLFRPLAFTKTFAMAAAAVLSVTIIPVLMAFFITPRCPQRWGRQTRLFTTLAALFLPAAALCFVPALLPETEPYRWWMVVGWMILAAMLLLPQKITHEEKNPLSLGLQKLYEPFFRGAIRFRWVVLMLAVLLVASAIWPFSRLGSEFMPPLDEGDLLYMPTTDPSISVTKARQVLQQTDKLIKAFPEVVSVYGKMGRAESATDPAPLDMVETVVRLNTDPATWRTRSVHHWFDGAPHWLTWPLHHTFWPQQERLTMNELVQGWDDADGHHDGMDATVRFPGLGNLWPMPIDNRLKMLSTGVKSPVGLKILGPDLQTLAKLAEQASAILKQSVPGTTDAYPERAFGGYYLDININRSAAAGYGLTTGDVQDVISTAVGGMKVSTAVEGLERYPINLRYARDLRDDSSSLKQILIPTPSGAQIPLGELADMKINPGPPMIRSEGGRPETLVYVVPNRDVGSYVDEAKQVIAQKLALPAGYSMSWSGEFEQIQETNARLVWAVPLTLLIVAVLLFLATASVFRVAVVMLAIPFSLVGAVWLLWLLGYHLSGAVWVGMIALAGLDAETGLVMLLYLDNSYERFKAQGKMKSREDLLHAVHDGAVKRIRPKTMTVAAAFIGLVPLLWASGTGADVMRRLAAPMLGGLFTSFLMELLVYPVIFFIAKSIMLNKNVLRLSIGLSLVAALTGCTIHPAGERAEREASLQAGKPFTRPVEDRDLPLLPDNPTPDDLVQYALLRNADLEQRYWEWRAAIEQIPQDGTQASTLALSAGTAITRGRATAGNSTIGLLNDPMTDIHWPGTLATAAQRTLENARAAGIRFRKTQYELRNKVLIAYYDYALIAELIRLEQSNAELLRTMAMVVDARNRAGAAGQQDLLKARNELDLSRNDIANMQSQLSAQRAALNALLGREPDAPLPSPTELPPRRPMSYSDAQLLELAARRNPELAALASEIRARQEGIKLARLQYVPDFNVSLSTDLMGIAQNLVGSATIPLLRYEAINASIAQAEANLKASEAMRRQTHQDLSAQVVMDIVSLRDADRQLDLFDHTVLPRTRQVVTVGRSAYEAGQSTLLDFLDCQRSLIAVQRLVANLRSTREKRLADLEALTARDLAEPSLYESRPIRK